MTWRIANSIRHCHLLTSVMILTLSCIMYSQDLSRPILAICTMWRPISARNSLEHNRRVLLHSVTLEKDLFLRVSLGMQTSERGRIEHHSLRFRSMKKNISKTHSKSVLHAWFCSLMMVIAIGNLSTRRFKRLPRITRLKTSFSEFHARSTALA